MTFESNSMITKSLPASTVLAPIFAGAPLIMATTVPPFTVIVITRPLLLTVTTGTTPGFGFLVGFAVGLAVGLAVGFGVGFVVGLVVGFGVGITLTARTLTSK